MVIFLQEREPVKSDHLIRDPVCAEEVPYGFGYEENDLEQSESGIGTWEDKILVPWWEGYMSKLQLART